MNIHRSTLRRRRFLRSGSTIALGVMGTVLAGRRLVRVPPAPPSEIASGDPGAAPRIDPEPVPPEPVLEELNQSTLAEPSPPVPPRPLEYEEEYAEFLGNLDLRHLSPHEIIDPHRGIVNGVANVLPPKKAWKELVPALRLADEIRERLGVPLCRITSAYRCPAYNTQIPGAVRRSYHTRNLALDVVYYCPPRKAYEMALKLRRQGFFRGGVGIYPTFIHLDTRGYAATWRG